jgi:fructose/tagatose bisphosphate aldolase
VKFVPMAELLRHAVSEGYAVPSFCVWNPETMEAVLQSAEKLKAPVIMMSGTLEFALLKPADMGAIAQTVARRFQVRAALHLDHGDSLELVEACLAAGYTSVMLDYSSRPLHENAEAMRRVVAMARPRQFLVYNYRPRRGWREKRICGRAGRPSWPCRAIRE